MATPKKFYDGKKVWPRYDAAPKVQDFICNDFNPRSPSSPDLLNRMPRKALGRTPRLVPGK